MTLFDDEILLIECINAAKSNYMDHFFFAGIGDYKKRSLDMPPICFTIYIFSFLKGLDMFQFCMNFGDKSDLLKTASFYKKL